MRVFAILLWYRYIYVHNHAILTIDLSKNCNGDCRYTRSAVPGALGAGVGAAAEEAASLDLFTVKPE